MHINLPNPQELNINSLEESVEIIKLLLLKITEIEAREPIRDTGLVEEIIHLRKETHNGFQELRKEISQRFENMENTFESMENTFENMENKFESMENKLDKNILAVQALEAIMKGGFDSVGKVLQEISNKLDK